MSGNKKPQRAIENEFNMQKHFKLTNFLFFAINLLLLTKLSGQFTEFDTKYFWNKKKLEEKSKMIDSDRIEKKVEKNWKKGNESPNRIGK